jgi:hypothetical protein
VRNLILKIYFPKSDVVRKQKRRRGHVRDPLSILSTSLRRQPPEARDASNPCLFTFEFLPMASHQDLRAVNLSIHHSKITRCAIVVQFFNTLTCQAVAPPDHDGYSRRNDASCVTTQVAKVIGKHTVSWHHGPGEYDYGFCSACKGKEDTARKDIEEI